MMLCYRRLIDDDPYSVILCVPRVESRFFSSVHGSLRLIESLTRSGGI
jgi:hypothetical protein